MYAFDINLNLEGKTAIITGGASGIGYATAQMMNKKGANVILIDIDAKVVTVAQSIEGSIGIQMDISNYGAVEKQIKLLVESGNRFDILCNIAGLGSSIDATEISQSEFDKVIQVNLNSAFYMCQIVGREMIEKKWRGRIINMASQAGIVALQGHVAYSASKAGLLAVTRDLALEWGKYGITINAISPTVVMTPMARDHWSGERGTAHLAQIPVGRFAEMDEIAMAVCYLASDSAAMINGANLIIDGGFTIC